MAGYLAAAALAVVTAASPLNAAADLRITDPTGIYVALCLSWDGKKESGPAFDACMALKLLSPANPARDGAVPAKSIPDYGALTPVAGTRNSDFCFASLGLAIDPSEEFVYFSGGIGSPGKLCGFKRDPVTGAFAAIPGTPADVGSNPRAVAIDPSARFLYVAGNVSGATGNLYAFAIDRTTGTTAPLPGSPFATRGSIPNAVVIDRAGRFAYVSQGTSVLDGSLAVLAIDAATGALSHIPGSPFPSEARALALSPDGRFLFAGGSSLETYALNATTGVPTRIGTRAGYYYGVAVDPTGRFLFAPSDIDGLLHGFSIAANGALTPAGTPQSIGVVTRATTAILAIADLVYVGNYATGAIYGFRVNPASGALAPVAGSPFVTGGTLPAVMAGQGVLPKSVQIDASDNLVATLGGYGGTPPYKWSVASGALPPGLALNADTGVISGTAAAGGDHPFTVMITDTVGATATAARRIVVAGGAAPAAVTLVEFYNTSLDHYFITHVADEITKLDTGVFKGWARTGWSFKGFAGAASGTAALCRIYIPPGKGDGHFFGRDAAECDGTMAKNPTFVLESATFFYDYPPTQGVCAAGQVPVYRVFSNRADANHRYTTSRAVRDQMMGKGWLAEGDGADTVVMCAPA